MYQIDNEEITSVVNLLFSENKSTVVNIIQENVSAIWKQFKNNFKLIQAAGGVVLYQDRILLIHRLGKWDLPKGKLEENESISACAIREVQEECGIDSLEIIKQLPSTFHMYTDKKGAIVLKETFWFEMQSKEESEVKPQIEEGIEEVKWVSRKNLKEYTLNTYSSLKELMAFYEMD